MAAACCNKTPAETQTVETPPVKMHLSINVANLERSVAFYEAFFGTPPHKVRPGYANFDLAVPPLKFALNEKPVEQGQRTLNHLGLQMPDICQVNKAKQRLQAAGLATFDETNANCCYAKQDKVWAHDPDGNEWEIYVVTEDVVEEHEDHPSPTVTEVCCR